MKSTFRPSVFLSVILFSSPVLSSAQSIVYDNTTKAETFSGGRQVVYTPADPTAEFGDQVTLTNVPSDRTLSQFSFYYFYGGPATNQLTATVRFYSNTGTNPPTMGNKFYESDSISLTNRNATGYGTEMILFSAANPAVNLPETFTWTVQFSNLGLGAAGLLAYGPPSVGTSFNDFWLSSGTSWQTETIVVGATAVADSSFGAQVTAVPEPSVYALGALALLARLGLARYRRHRT